MKFYEEFEDKLL